MHNTQAEVQRLQAKLQVIGHRRRQTRQPSTSSYLSVTDSTLASNPAADPVHERQGVCLPHHSVSLPFAAPAPANIRPTPAPTNVRLTPAVGLGAREPKPPEFKPATGSVGSDRCWTTSVQPPQVAPRRQVELRQQPAPARSARPADDSVGWAVNTARGNSTDVPGVPTLRDTTVLREPQPLPPVSLTADVAQLADTLRHHRYPGTTHSPKAGIQTGLDYLLRFGKRLGRSLSYPLLRQPLSGSTADISVPDDASAEVGGITLQDGILWIAASAAVRVGLDLLLVTYSGLWLPVVAVIVVPAAIAIYRTAVNPEAGFALGGRLLLIMIGLLLGGRVL